MPVALLLFDERDEVVHANAEAERVFRGAPVGMSMEEVVTEPLPSLDGIDRAEVSLCCLDGQTTAAVLSRSWFGEPRRQVWVALEITERRHLEAQLRHAQKLQAIGTLSAGLCHELNTPVYYILDNLGFIEEACTEAFSLLEVARDLLAEKNTKEAGRRFADRCTEVDLSLFAAEVPQALSSLRIGAERVATIVRAMKSFSHPQHAKMTFFDVNEGVRNVAVIASSEYKYVADLRLDLGPVPRVKCRGDDLNTVILNLIVNAAHAIRGAGRDKGVIRVETSDGDDYVEIVVADNGTGISDDVRDRIFEPFFTTKPAGVGTGQGLAMARDIMAAHGGSIHLHTDLGRGSTFTLRLPKSPRRGGAT